MSARCKVCNTSKAMENIQVVNDDKWECQTCGNLLDAQGYVAVSK